MQKLPIVLALFASLAVAACGKSTPTPCDKYAEMEVRCNDKGGEGVRGVARQFCESAQKDKDTEVLSAMIALEAECAQTETACDAYHACIEKKKAETTPPGL
jgi:hypothetical protein